MVFYAFGRAGVGELGVGLGPLLPFRTRASFQSAMRDFPAGLVPRSSLRSTPGYPSMDKEA
jgi:hypothetical protein